MNLERVRAAIKTKGCKHKWLAGQIGVHPVTFSRFMTGKTPLNKPSLILLCQILELKNELEALQHAS